MGARHGGRRLNLLQLGAAVGAVLQLAPGVTVVPDGAARDRGRLELRVDAPGDSVAVRRALPDEGVHEADLRHGQGDGGVAHWGFLAAAWASQNLIANAPQKLAAKSVKLIGASERVSISVTQPGRNSRSTSTSFRNTASGMGSVNRRPMRSARACSSSVRPSSSVVELIGAVPPLGRTAADVFAGRGRRGRRAPPRSTPAQSPARRASRGSTSRPSGGAAVRRWGPGSWPTGGRGGRLEIGRA